MNENTTIGNDDHVDTSLKRKQLGGKNNFALHTVQKCFVILHHSEVSNDRGQPIDKVLQTRDTVYCQNETDIWVT